VGVGGGYGEAGDDDCNLLASQYGWGGEFVNAPGGGCVKKQNVKGTGKDDPTNQYFSYLELLSKIATGISILIVVCAICAKVWPLTAAFFLGLQVILAKALIAVGALMTLLALMVYGMGRKVEGEIFTLFGALTMLGGYLSMVAGEEAQAEQKAAEEATKEMTKEAAKEAMKKSLAGSLGKALTTNAWTGGLSGGITGGMDASAASRAGDVDPRTWNPDTNSWE
jgi:hypothetical protein